MTKQVYNKCKFFCCKHKKKRTAKGIFTVHFPWVHPQFYLKGLETMILPADKKVTVAVLWKDKKGNVAPVDGIPIWESSDSTVAALTVAPDGLSASVAGGLIGLCQISVTADADLGEGVTNVAAILEVEVLAGQAVSGDFSVGPLEDQ